ncbi:MAG: FAD-binding protein, partial [Burkholderiaceae bacterium]
MILPKPRKRLMKDADAARLNALPDSAFASMGVDRARLAALLDAFKGQLVFPGQPGYEQDRQESNPAFQAYPLLIAYCEAFSDVSEILALARQFDLKVACRSGGHSTAGYSVNDGIVLDTSRLNDVSVDAVAKTATVGPGTNFEKLNATLDSYRLHVPGGGCPEVCVGGYMQGGGYGFTSREFGMHCDNVLSVLVMLADTSIVKADAANHADLFWAIRGGTGNNFGVLLQTTYRLLELWQIWGFGLRWSLDDAPAALVAMQQGFMRSGATSRLGYMTVITLQQDGGQWLLMRGVYDGTQAQALQELAPMLATRGAHFDIALQRNSYYRINTLLLETPPWEIPYVPPQPPNTTIKEDKQAGYIARPVPLAHWQKLVAYYRSAPMPFNTVVLEPYGGRINAQPVYANAFVHRDVDMDFFVDTFWVDDADRPRAVQWLDGFMQLMAPYFNGEVYQNYPRRNTPNFRQAYWGGAFPALLACKLRYNDTALFDYEQSISPGPYEPADGAAAAPIPPACALTPEAYSAPL